MKHLLVFVFTLFVLNLAQAKPVKEKKCNDQHLTYKTCTDQQVLYDKYFNKAKSTQKTLLVKFGFETCDWCQSLNKMLKKGKLKTYADKNFVVASININEDSGKKVFEKVKGAYKNPSSKTGYPFLVIVNPQNNKSVYKDTGDLEDNTNGRGHNSKKVKAALNAALKKIK